MPFTVRNKGAKQIQQVLGQEYRLYCASYTDSHQHGQYGKRFVTKILQWERDVLMTVERHVHLTTSRPSLQRHVLVRFGCLQSYVLVRLLCVPLVPSGFSESTCLNMATPDVKIKSVPQRK